MTTARFCITSFSKSSKISLSLLEFLNLLFQLGELSNTFITSSRLVIASIHLHAYVYAQACSAHVWSACRTLLPHSIVRPRYGTWAIRLGGKCHPLATLQPWELFFEVHRWLRSSFFVCVCVPVCVHTGLHVQLSLN